jgi:hypothetical protein
VCYDYNGVQLLGGDVGGLAGSKRESAKYHGLGFLLMSVVALTLPFIFKIKGRFRIADSKPLSRKC